MNIEELEELMRKNGGPAAFAKMAGGMGGIEEWRLVDWVPQLYELGDTAIHGTTLDEIMLKADINALTTAESFSWRVAHVVQAARTYAGIEGHLTHQFARTLTHAETEANRIKALSSELSYWIIAANIPEARETWKEMGRAYDRMMAYLEEALNIVQLSKHT